MKVFRDRLFLHDLRQPFILVIYTLEGNVGWVGPIQPIP